LRVDASHDHRSAGRTRPNYESIAVNDNKMGASFSAKGHPTPPTATFLQKNPCLSLLSAFWHSRSFSNMSVHYLLAFFSVTQIYHRSPPHNWNLKMHPPCSLSTTTGQLTDASCLYIKYSSGAPVLTCNRDSADCHALSFQLDDSSNMTVENCVDTCSAAGYIRAGLVAATQCCAFSLFPLRTYLSLTF
jgi:hypothetical protein